jgi:hypothetical protein
MYIVLMANVLAGPSVFRNSDMCQVMRLAIYFKFYDLSFCVALHVSTTAPHDANSDVSSKEGATMTSGTGINYISIKLKQ